MERRLPSEVSDFDTHDLYVGSQLAAVAWYADNPISSREVTQRIDPAKHCLSAPGIRLLKINVPIGPPNLFADNVRAKILNWYVGEVHIVAREVLPDASGEGLRLSATRAQFIEELQKFYQRLEDKAENKSIRLNLVKKMQQGLEAAKTLEQDKSLREGEKVPFLAKVATAVETIESISSKRKSTVLEQRIRTAAREPGLLRTKVEVEKALEAGG